MCVDVHSLMGAGPWPENNVPYEVVTGLFPARAAFSVQCSGGHPPGTCNVLHFG